MRSVRFGSEGARAPGVILGCMRIADMSYGDLDRLIKTALDLGVNWFDLADIYGNGRCEERFGEFIANNPSLRDSMFIQSKCGIVPGKMYDLSYEHIISCAEQSLRRMRIDHLDMLLAHRPDALMEPYRIAEAVSTLKGQDKILNFGVSNMNASQMELLFQASEHYPKANQLQFGPAVATMISHGMEANMITPGAINRDGGVLEACRIHGVTIQAWSPLQLPEWKGCIIGNSSCYALNSKLTEIGSRMGLSMEGVVASWIARHPAGIQMIAGTTNPDRLRALAEGYEREMSREDWYAIYMAAGNPLP